jgi:hypothetical protein
VFGFIRGLVSQESLTEGSKGYTIALVLVVIYSDIYQ